MSFKYLFWNSILSAVNVARQGTNISWLDSLRAGRWERMSSPETIVHDPWLHPPARLLSNFSGCHYSGLSRHQELQSS